MQDVRRIILGNPDIERLQARTHARHGTVMIAALDIDRTGKAALPFCDVIGDIRNKIGITTLGLSHHTVFVVARTQFGRTQPQRTFVLVGMTTGHKFRDGVFHTS